MCEYKILAWYFARDDKVNNDFSDDKRKFIVGKWMHYKDDYDYDYGGVPRGFHSYENILGAHVHAAGSTICRVESVGITKNDGYSGMYSTDIRVLWWLEPDIGKEVIRKYICKCALDVQHMWEMPNIVKRYLLTQDESIRKEVRDLCYDIVYNKVDKKIYSTRPIYAAIGATVPDVLEDACRANDPGHLSALAVSEKSINGGYYDNDLYLLARKRQEKTFVLMVHSYAARKK